MTFTAENNNIRVTDTNGDVVFDTDTPMPHIVGVINASVSHVFPDSPAFADTATTYFRESMSCASQEYSCRSEYVCNREWVCETRRECGYQTDPWTGESGYVCETVRDCGYETVCGNELVCDWQTVYGTLALTFYWNVVEAADFTSVYTLGAVEPGTNPDFLQVIAVANRTHAGSQIDYGTFVSAIPNTQRIAANGSTVLEMAFEPGGSPWLSRIMSVYLSGDNVMVEFRHSNRHYVSRKEFEYRECDGFGLGFEAAPDQTGSNWTVDFDVYVGKFTV